ncbi:MAG: hypothetical protein COW32_09280 [Candidatus Aquicultor secundus]|nr:MAG: hypothetical protein COW32_09280 [Candidatus Aquicultor secundus]
MHLGRKTLRDNIKRLQPFYKLVRLIKVGKAVRKALDLLDLIPRPPEHVHDLAQGEEPQVCRIEHSILFVVPVPL